MRGLKFFTNFIIHLRVCWIILYIHEHIYEMVSAGKCILARNQSSNVIRQQRVAADRASQNYRHSRICRLLRKRQTPRCDVARERNSFLFYSFSPVPLSLPAPFLYICFSDIVAYSILSQFATVAHENPRNKDASFQRLACTNISKWSSDAVSKTACSLSSRKVIFNLGRRSSVPSSVTDLR